MYKIDWNSFRSKNENFTKSFEELCYQLFCRKHKFPEGIRADFNQAGLETYPKLSSVLGMSVGFQSKFFENGTDYSQIKKSVETAIEEFGDDLDEITIYINSNAKLSSKPAKDINALAKLKNVAINWYTQSNFAVDLNQPGNLDLAQLYFGFGDEDGFIRSNISVADLNFIQTGYLDLPVVKLPTREAGELELTENLSLLTGSPGSGKSILVKYLFCTYAKLFESRAMYEKNLALPMLINLKDCYSEGLENLIRHRQKDYQVRGKSLKFIYILDGLDELNSTSCDTSLRYVKKLVDLSSTERIIISCRRGSLNKLKVREYFDHYSWFEIDNLTEEYIDRYFEKKDDKVKIQMLAELKKHNSELIKDVTDIFLIKLLWDTIGEIGKNSTIIDLLELKIHALLKEVRHRNNLSELNLLIPKEDAIMKLNERFSYRFSKKYQFRFKHSAISKFLTRQYPSLDYDAINKIADYNISTFFDGSTDQESNDNSYIYQHRRYQEYFYARNLKKKFEKDIKIIRSAGIIVNDDFFDDIFIKHLEKEYKKVNDLPALMLLSSIKFYQKSGDQWYIRESPYFIDCLVSQKNSILEVLLHDDVLNAKEYISATYENALRFYENEKSSIADQLIANSTEEFGKYEDVPSLKEIEGQLFYKFSKLEKGNVSYVSFFLGRYRTFYKNFNSNSNSILDEQSPKEYVIKSYFLVGLKHFRLEMLKLIEELNEEELCFFLDLLSKTEHLPLFFSDQQLQEAISVRIKKFRKKPTIYNLSVFLFRKLLDLNVSEKQVEDILAVVMPQQGYIREHSFKRHIHPFALAYIITGEANFMKERNTARDFPAVDDVVKYCTLFEFYINSIRSVTSFSKNLNQFATRFGQWYPAKNKVKAELSKLWAYIFYHSKANRTDYFKLKKTHGLDLDELIFLEYLNKIDPNNFANVATEDELVTLMDSLEEWREDYSQYINRCFLLSGMFSQINTEKALDLIKNAFVNSKLRHGWRKDIFISDFFNISFSQILQKNWLSKKEILDLADSIFSLNLRLYEVTDRDHTRYGIWEFLDALAGYDVKLAYNYQKKFQKLDLDGYVASRSLIAIIIHDIRTNSLPYDKVQKKLSGWRFKNDQYTQALFGVEMEFLKSDYYDDETKRLAVENASNIVKSIYGKFEYQKGIVDDHYDIYNSYCLRFEKENEIVLESDETGEYNIISQEEFLEQIENVSNKKKLKELYDTYINRKNKIVIADRQIWNKWIEKTLSIEGNIDLFIHLAEGQAFLKTGFWEIHNSEYFYLGVASCIDNPNAKEQMEKFLIENAGYGAFYKMTYVYIALNDKKNALDLFQKFYKFCDFLVN